MLIAVVSKQKKKKQCLKLEFCHLDNDSDAENAI